MPLATISAPDLLDFAPHGARAALHNKCRARWSCVMSETNQSRSQTVGTSRSLIMQCVTDLSKQDRDPSRIRTSSPDVIPLTQVRRPAKRSRGVLRGLDPNAVLPPTKIAVPDSEDDVEDEQAKPFTQHGTRGSRYGRAPANYDM